MQTIVKFTILLLMVVAIFAFGYENAFNYAAKARNEKAEFQLRLAKIDLWSYLLTSVPLFAGMIILLNKDPFLGGVFDAKSVWSDVATMSFFLIAAVGIGAGVARRRLVLISVAER